MANDLTRLSRKMKRHAKSVPEAATKITRAVALTIDQTLVLATPVDTGRARSNWIAEVGTTPPTGVIEPYSPGSHLGAGEGANARAALAQAKAQIDTYNKEEQKIFLVNNVRYIEALNQGSSPQAEAGFVQTAIARAVQVARKFKIIVGSSA